MSEGLSFKFTEEQDLIRSTVREFAEKEVRPWIRYIDENGDQPEGHSKLMELWGKAGELGITGMGIPPEHGGVIIPAVTHGVVFEEMGRRSGSLHVIRTGLTGTTSMLVTYGSNEIKEKYLPRIAKGEMLPLVIASTEPGCGSDVSAISTTAIKKGDEYLLNGEKTFISGVKFADAAVVFCKTDPNAGHRGISTIIVEMKRPGITKHFFRGLGWHHIELGGFAMKDVRVPVKNLIGEENKGFYMILGMFDVMRAIAGCGAIGVAQGALDESIEYVKQRTAFGRPVGKFEAVQFRIAEDATMLEAARWLCYRTLWMKDQELPITKEAAMVKWWVPYVCFNIVNNCIQNQGAVGYTSESLNEYRLREIRGLWIGDGTIDIQKMIIGRALLGKECDPTK